MHIRMISPVVQSGDWTAEATHAESLAALETETLKLSCVLLDQGPESVEYRYEEAMLIPDMVRKAVAAEGEGVDGLLVESMADPGVDVLRECVSIPVVGPGRLSMQMATLMGRRFSILVELDIVGRLFDEEVRSYGLASRYAGYRSIDIPVLEIDADPARTTKLLVEAAKQAVKEDRADIFVLGCTRFAPLVSQVQARLAEQGITVPVLNPLTVAVHVLEGLIKSGVSHSKVAYPYPAGKRIVGFDMPTIGD